MKIRRYMKIQIKAENKKSVYRHNNKIEQKLNRQISID